MMRKTLRTALRHELMEREVEEERRQLAVAAARLRQRLTPIGVMADLASGLGGRRGGPPGGGVAGTLSRLPVALVIVAGGLTAALWSRRRGAAPPVVHPEPPAAAAAQTEETAWPAEAAAEFRSRRDDGVQDAPPRRDGWDSVFSGLFSTSGVAEMLRHRLDETRATTRDATDQAADFYDRRPMVSAAGLAAAAAALGALLAPRRAAVDPLWQREKELDLLRAELERLMAEHGRRAAMQQAAAEREREAAAG